MPRRVIRVAPRHDEQVPEPIREGIEAAREELGIEAGHGPAALREAEESAARGPRLPDPGETPWRDLTDIEVVTIDPASSTDLDQAVHVERRDKGFRVHYAIADVAAWVEPGGPLDAETRRRGQTFYAPHRRYSLHPTVLSESAASLLDDGLARPAVLWTLDLDADGDLRSTAVERAMVRSRAKLSYEGVQRDLDAGRAVESLELLAVVGRLRQEREAERGGVSLDLPDQEVVVDEAGRWSLQMRHSLPVEGWNAQISLLTGMAAARIMADGGVGLLRTLPPPSNQTVDTLRAVAGSLGVDWPEGASYAQVMSRVDTGTPAGMALASAGVMLFRGAGYTRINGSTRVEGRGDAGELVHVALAARYAHATAPLRRLVDRFVSETCLHLVQGSAVPQWVLSGLDELPGLMADSDHRAHRFERRVVDLTEALVLADRVGDELSGVVVSADEKGDSGRVVIDEPAVDAAVHRDGAGPALTAGTRIRVKVEGADTTAGKVDLTVQP